VTFATTSSSRHNCFYERPLTVAGFEPCSAQLSHMSQSLTLLPTAPSWLRQLSLLYSLFINSCHLESKILLHTVVITVDGPKLIMRCDATYFHSAKAVFSFQTRKRTYNFLFNFSLLFWLYLTVKYGFCWVKITHVRQQ